MQNKRKYMKEVSTVLLDRKNIFMYFAIPKIASRSISRIVLADRIVHWKIHADEYPKKFDEYSNQEIRKMFKFAIVRNPFDRVVSSFFYVKSCGRIPYALHFRDFVKNILIKKGTGFDSHFWKQTRFICYNGELLVNRLIRLENIDEDWKEIASIIKCDDYLPRKNRIRRKKFFRYYDKECVEIIKEIYSRDFQLLNYEFPVDLEDLEC